MYKLKTDIEPQRPANACETCGRAVQASPLSLRDAPLVCAWCRCFRCGIVLSREACRCGTAHGTPSEVDRLCEHCYRLPETEARVQDHPGAPGHTASEGPGTAMPSAGERARRLRLERFLERRGGFAGRRRFPQKPVAAKQKHAPADHPVDAVDRYAEKTAFEPLDPASLPEVPEAKLQVLGRAAGQPLDPDDSHSGPLRTSTPADVQGGQDGVEDPLVSIEVSGG